MSSENTIQRNHKDTVFHDLFSDKGNALSLYNALNGTDYEDADSLEIVTLSDAIYIQGKNDVSVLFPRAMSQVPCLHEHLANAARVKYPAALQRCKLDTPLLAARYLISESADIVGTSEYPELQYAVERADLLCT